MIASFLYLCLYAWHFILPGYLIVRLLTIRRGAFLLAIALSYSLLLLNLLPMEWLKAPGWVFTLAFNLQVAILLAANVIAGYRRHGSEAYGGEIFKSVNVAAAFRCRVFPLRMLARWWPPLAIIAGVCVYLAWAGPYTELLSDPLTHIGRILAARQTSVEPGHFDQFWQFIGHNSLFDLLTRQGGHWYILQALLCRWSGLAIPDLPGPLTLANTIVFCLSIYSFALFLWSGRRIQRRQKIWIALWSVGFTVLWLGINIFAYVRYYALAPAILNYVIYLAAVIVILDYFRSRSWRGHALWLAPLLVMAMNVIHTQEAMFACFMGLGILIVMEGQWVWGWWRRKRRTSNIQLPTPNVGFRNTNESGLTGVWPPVPNMLKIHVFFIGGLIAFCLLFYFSLHKPMAGYSDFVLRPLFNGEWLGQSWFIQPLTGQFAQVVTWWGVFVYGLFLLHIRYFKRQPFILAGMLMPCLIVFNPLTIAILSRWVPDLNAIYRFNYMIPLPFVAGFLAMRFWDASKLCLRQIYNSHAPDERPPDRSDVAAVQSRLSERSGENCNGLPARGVFTHFVLWLRGIWSAAAFLGLLILLTPVETLMGRLSNSRLYTLKPVAEGNDHRRWGDLIALARKHPQIHVTTDPYTCILLNWMDVKVMNGGWWIAPAAPGADRRVLLRNLDKTKDWWLVINRRNGDFSMNGARSGHWCGDALMHFSTVYPEDLLLFVGQHPELFKEIWNKNQIQVYDIVETRVWE